MELDYANEHRRRYAAEHGLDVMYAETTFRGFDCRTYSDGVKVPMRTFATLEGLQAWGKRNHYAIIYVS